MTVAQYKKIAESDAYKTPLHFDYKDLERKYWDIMTYTCPIYGVDVSGSITDKDVDVCVKFIHIINYNLFYLKCIFK